MRSILIALLLTSATSAAESQLQSKARSKQPTAFKWVTPLPEGKYPGLRHATFNSQANGVEVGY